MDKCNKVFQDERSAYRFVGRQITPIYDETTGKEIETALLRLDNSPFANAKIHISTAISKISDRQQPDYRNSIKESISAVESVARVLCDDENATLGKALKKFDIKVNIHPALKDAFLKIYGYTSDENGIRHALSDESDLDLEDAAFMLAACSAFINYVIVKAQKADVLNSDGDIESDDTS
jgi:hypothetical protein